VPQNRQRKGIARTAASVYTLKEPVIAWIWMITTLSTGWQGWDLWVTARTLRTPEDVQALIEFVRTHPVRALYVQGVVGGYAYYPSELLPRTRYHRETPGFDPFRMLLDSLPHHPLHLWINAMLWWTVEDPPEDSTHLLYTHPEWFVHDDAGRSVTTYTYKERVLAGIDGLFLNPWAEGVPAFLAEVADEALRRYPRLAGIHLDFIRYPGNRFGYDPQKVEAFRATYGVDPRWIPGYLRGWNPRWLLTGELHPVERWLATLHLAWNETRVEGIARVVRAVRNTLRRRHPGKRLSAAVFPNPATARLLLGQDWVGWLQQDILDRAVIMAYTPDPERYTKYLHTWHSPFIRFRVSPGIGIWFAHPERYLRRELRLLRGAGFSSVTVFDYGTLQRHPRTLRLLLEDHRHPRATPLPPYPRRDSTVCRRPAHPYPDGPLSLRESDNATQAAPSPSRYWFSLFPPPLDRVVLEECGLDPYRMAARMEEDQRLFRALQAWLGRHPITDSTLVPVPEFRTYRRIWLPYPPQARPWERLGVRLRAGWILLRHLLGTPFETLARTYSHHPSRRWGGEGPWIWNTGTSRLEQKVFALQEEGDVTWLDTSGGILLLQLVARKPARTSPFGSLQGEERAAAFLQWLIHHLYPNPTREEVSS